MGTQQRNGFTPLGNFQKIRLPNSRLKLRWPRPETRGKVDINKLEENFRQILDQLDENHAYLNRTDWGSALGTRWATIVIAAADSTSASKQTADYVCGSADASTVINAAVTALINSRTNTIGIGRIVLLEGTYTLLSPISVTTLGARTVVFQGMGMGGFETSVGATRLLASGNAAFNFGGSSVSAGSTCVVQDLHITCGGSDAGIKTRDMTTIVRNCSIVASGSGGCINQSNGLGTGAGSQYTGNYLYSTGSGASALVVDVGSGVDHAILVANNVIHFTGAGNGVSCTNNASTIPSYVVSDNHITGSSSTAGVGIDLHPNAIETCTVTGNVVRTCSIGIWCAGYRHNIASNMIGNVTDGISTAADSQYLAILGNHVTDYSGIAFSLANSAIRPTVIGNKASNGGSSACTVASGVVNAFVGYNDFGGGTVSNAGTGTTIVQDLPTGGAANFVLKKLSATTGDFDWAVDPALDLFAAKADLLIGVSTDSGKRFGIGRDDALLLPDSTTTDGLKWGRALYVSATDPSLSLTPLVGDIWIDTT